MDKNKVKEVCDKYRRGIYDRGEALIVLVYQAGVSAKEASKILNKCEKEKRHES